VIPGVAYQVIRVPEDDDFNLSAAFHTMTPTAQESAELIVAHPFLNGHGGDEELEASKALRATSSGLFAEHYNALRTAMSAGT